MEPLVILGYGALQEKYKNQLIDLGCIYKGGQNAYWLVPESKKATALEIFNVAKKKMDKRKPSYCRGAKPDMDGNYRES